MREGKDFIVDQLKKDRDLRCSYLNEAVSSLLDKSEYRVGLSMIRNLINATCGFEQIAKVIGKNPKSIMRMLNDANSPRSDNLFEIISYLLTQEVAQIEVTPKLKVA